jgi:hypothetical protein
MPESVRSQNNSISDAYRSCPPQWDVFEQENDSTAEDLQPLSIVEDDSTEPFWQDWTERVMLGVHPSEHLSVYDDAITADPKRRWFRKALREFAEVGRWVGRTSKTHLKARLEGAEQSYPEMSAQFADAISFAASFDDRLLQPAIWTDNESEVVLEWILPDGRHAVVSFEGDGEFGYTLLTGGRFVPGLCSGTKPFRVPFDLVRYLSMK